MQIARFPTDVKIQMLVGVNEFIVLYERGFSLKLSRSVKNLKWSRIRKLYNQPQLSQFIC